jgi:acyl-CoA thioester hydrolase
MKYQYPLYTRYVETAQDGIIHHSSYVVYLEAARIEFLKSKGWDINSIEKMKMYSPVVDLSIKYKKILLSLENIIIEVDIDVCSDFRFCFNYKIIRKDECIAIAKSSHCFVNQSFKLIPIPKNFAMQMKK